MCFCSLIFLSCLSSHGMKYEIQLSRNPHRKYLRSDRHYFSINLSGSNHKAENVITVRNHDNIDKFFLFFPMKKLHCKLRNYHILLFYDTEWKRREVKNMFKYSSKLSGNESSVSRSSLSFYHHPDTPYRKMITIKQIT